MAFNSLSEYAKKFYTANTRPLPLEPECDKCPQCGFAVTYRGFVNVECGTRSDCANYVAPAPTVHRVGSTDLIFGDPFGGDEPTQTGGLAIADVMTARTWLIAGGKVEYRVRSQLQPTGATAPGPWFPIHDLADLQFIQGNISDASMDSLFDFQAR